MAERAYWRVMGPVYRRLMEANLWELSEEGGYYAEGHVVPLGQRSWHTRFRESGYDLDLAATIIPPPRFRR